TQAASGLRATLGESLASIRRFDRPLEEATTSSLEALKAFSDGAAARARGADVQALGFFRRATELDPKFALAYMRLSAIYSGAAELEVAAQYASRAYQFRESVGPHERFSILYAYEKRVSGDLDRAFETLTLWKQTYPRDFDAAINLSFNYGQTGEYDKALAEARDAARLNPGYSQATANLARAHLGLNQFDEAKRASEGTGTGPVGVLQRSYLLMIAFAAGDNAA